MKPSEALILTIIFACFGGFTGYMAGSVGTDIDWRTGCEKVSVHVASNGKVYDCKERK